MGKHVRALGPFPGPQTALWAADVDLVLFGGAAGSGKAQPLEAVVPTPSGWATIGSLSVGDFVFDEFGRPTRVVALHPIEQQTTYRVHFRGGAVVECSGRHLWRTHMLEGGPGELHETHEILASIHKRPHAVARAGALQLPRADLAEAPSSLGERLALTPGPIPVKYLRSSIAQRMELLIGLTGGRSVWHTKSAELRQGMLELLASLGLDYAESQSEEGWLLTINRRARSSWLYIEDVSIAPAQPMRCITVENASGLYLTGREHIVTHNSYISLLLALLYAKRTPGFTCLVARATQRDLVVGGGLWDTGQELAALLGGKCRGGQYMDIRFPNGSRIKFDYLPAEGYQRYRGSQYAMVIIDEAVECSFESLVFLTSRMRTTCGVVPFMVLTMNPDPDHELARFVAPFLDEKGYPRRELAGTVMYFARSRKSDDFVVGAVAEEVAKACDRPLEELRTYTFIDALVTDNRVLANDANYLATLASQGAELEEQLRRGCWTQRTIAGGMFREHWWGGVLEQPIGKIIRRARAWDLADTDPSKKKTRSARAGADWTVGCRMAWDHLGFCYIEHVVALRAEGPEVDDVIRHWAAIDGVTTTQVFEIEPGSSGKRDARTTAAQVRAILKNVKIHLERAEKAKMVKMRRCSNSLALGMRPHLDEEGEPTGLYLARRFHDEPGERVPRFYLLDCHGWIEQDLNDPGEDSPDTVGQLFWRQVLNCGVATKGRKFHDDIPDAMAIAYNASAPPDLQTHHVVYKPASGWARM